MGKGGGGGYDTSGLEKASKESVALQKQIYDQTRQDVQPWYSLGTGAVDKLGVLLGTSGGPASAADRGNLIEQYTPQFTSTQTQQPAQGVGGDFWLDTQTGRTYQASPVEGGHKVLSFDSTNYYVGEPEGSNFDGNYRNRFTQLGNSPQSTSTVDTQGLNAYVDNLLAQQADAAKNDPSYGSLLKSFGMDEYKADPGYQFRQDEAQKALERQMAAQGVTLGGAGAGQINPQAYRAMNELTQNLASQEYGNAYQRYTADNLNKFNMLMGAAGMGQNSTGIMAQTGQNYGNAASQSVTDLASAQQNAQLGKSSEPSMFSQIAPIALAAIAAFSDKNIKENITHVGQENGYPLYEFNYMGEDKKYIGVMAQDVEKINPDAVIEQDGLKMVDYDKIGVKMREV